MLHNKWILSLLYLFTFSIGIFLVGIDLYGFLDASYHYCGDLWDTRFNNVILEHNYRFFLGKEKSYWSAQFFFPAKNTLAGSDTHTATALFYCFFRIIGLDYFASFNLWLALLFLLNFISIIFVCNKLNVNIIPTLVGSYLFTFSIPVLDQVHHVQSLYKFPIPLIFYFTYQFLMYYNPRYLYGALFSFIILIYSSLYNIVFLIIPFLIFIFLIISFNLKKSYSLKENLTSLINKLFTKNKWHFIISIVILLIAYLPIHIYYGNHHCWDKNFLLNTISNWKVIFITHYNSILYGDIVSCLDNSIQPTAWEHHYNFGYISFFMFLLLLLYSILKKDFNSLIWIIPGIIFYVIYTKINDFTLFEYLAGIKGFCNAKGTWRFYLITLSTISIFYSIALDKFSKTINLKILSILFLIILITENSLKKNTLKYTDLNYARNKHLPLLNIIQKNRKSNHKAFVVLPDSTFQQEAIDLVSTMVAYQFSNLPTINGYTTYSPDGYCLDWSKPQKEQVYRWLKYNNWSDNDIENNVLYIYCSNDSTYYVK
ncbi:MAG: hypothetical protein KatS3mg027_1684 [Bacteroidia bacterium]|nr:MAG: hypothetical protein KatS3mg027_1684 [Bacteroidia bacterium]